MGGVGGWCGCGCARSQTLGAGLPQHAVCYGSGRGGRGTRGRHSSALRLQWLVCPCPSSPTATHQRCGVGTLQRRHRRVAHAKHLLVHGRCGGVLDRLGRRRQVHAAAGDASGCDGGVSRQVDQESRWRRAWPRRANQQGACTPTLPQPAPWPPAPQTGPLQTCHTHGRDSQGDLRVRVRVVNLDTWHVAVDRAARLC